MTVQELIDELMKIEDKTMDVRLADWAEGYNWPNILDSFEIHFTYMKKPCKPYLCLDRKGDLIP